MKRIILIISLISFGLVLSTSTSYAQGCDAPSSDEGVQVFGYIQPEINTQFLDETVVNFQFRRARIGVMGIIPYDFSYYVLLETSQFMNPGDRTGAFLLDAFVSYTRFDYFKISLGSFKYRFGNELSQACNALYTINRSKGVDELTGGIGGGNRDLGIMFLGGNKASLFQYYVSLTNGYGVYETQKNNLLDAYAVTGRVVVQPIEGLYLGASGRYMESPSETVGLPSDTKMRYGVDAEYSFRNFKLFGEYINGADDGSYQEGGGCGGDPVTKTGFQDAVSYYGMIVYRWNNFEPVYKFDVYSTMQGEEGVTGTKDVTSMHHTVGLNYYPNDWTRIQMNYVYRAEDPVEINNDCLIVQLQVKF